MSNNIGRAVLTLGMATAGALALAALVQEMSETSKETDDVPLTSEQELFLKQMEASLMKQNVPQAAIAATIVNVRDSMNDHNARTKAVGDEALRNDKAEMFSAASTLEEILEEKIKSFEGLFEDIDKFFTEIGDASTGKRQS